MRIASFNVENFFARAKALNTGSWTVGRPVLAAQAELNALLEQPTYSVADKARIVALLDTLGLTGSDTDDQGVIFSRDCPEYEIRTPGGHRLVVLVNHLKSKGYGTQADNNARRARQAQRVADIYQHREAKDHR